MKHAINWFQIPAVDFERAVKFYNTVLDVDMYKMPMGDSLMGFFPCDQGSVGGAVVFEEGCRPSAEGTMVFLNAGEDLGPALSRVEPAGEKLLLRKL